MTETSKVVEPHDTEPKLPAEPKTPVEPRIDAVEPKREEELAALRETANHTANQTADEGSVEVQGKLAVPYVEVVKRGQVKFTNEETGELEKTLAEPEDEVETPVPEYLEFHERVLDGEDPIALQKEYEAREVPEVKKNVK